MNGVPVTLFIILVASVTQARSQQYLYDNLKAEVAQIRSYVGKQYWLAETGKWTELCPLPDRDFEKCKKLYQGSFTIKSLALGEGSPADRPVGYPLAMYRVEMAGGQAGYISVIMRSRFLLESPKVTKDRAAAECGRRGQPKLGMTKQQATETCWGKPLKIIKTTTAAGVREDFLYGKDHILRFENESLSTIMESPR
jgi:hypothetical protein